MDCAVEMPSTPSAALQRCCQRPRYWMLGRIGSGGLLDESRRAVVLPVGRSTLPSKQVPSTKCCSMPAQPSCRLHSGETGGANSRPNDLREGCFRQCRQLLELG